MPDHSPTETVDCLFADRLAAPVGTVAEALGVSHGALAAAIRRGDFPHHRIGRRIVITRTDLETFLTAQGAGR